MKPDPEYLKTLLDAFEGAPSWSVDIGHLTGAGIASDDRLLFHIRILADRQLLEGAFQPDDLGIRQKLGGTAVLGGASLRLTSHGHDFAAALREPRVFEKVGKVIGESGLAVAVQLAGTLASQYAAQRLGLS